jgi:hypothetical protein
VPSQLSLVAFVVLHATPHAPQLVGDLTDDSHPSVSGAVFVQSRYPGAQPVYWHVVPALHVAPRLVCVSQAAPHALQLLVVLSGVEQPLVLGGVVLQSPQPVWQLWYSHVPPTQMPPLLCVVSHVCPQAPQLAAEPIAVSQPSRSGAAVLQSA